MQNSPTFSSPRKLRRKSIQTSSTDILSENDDETKRIAHRRELFTISASSSPSTSNDPTHSLDLEFSANIPALQMAESINQCIKLSAKNKINITNAFSLKMIDFMTYMIKKHDPSMSNLQMASTFLDVSAKIYGYRVDSLHKKVLKMVDRLNKVVIDNTEQNSEEQREIVHRDAEVNVEIKKNKMLSSVKALKGNIELVKPILAMIGEVDEQTSDMLYQATLPHHANSGFYQHPYNDVIVDVLRDTSESQSNSNVKFTIPTIEDFSNFEICASYSNFQFLGWSVEDKPEELSEEEIECNDNGNRFQFNLDASKEHNDDPVPMIVDIKHDANINENNVQACYQETADPDANVVEGTFVHNILQASEYSFVQPDLHQAGPSYWKFQNFARSSVATEDDIIETVETCRQAKMQKKNQFKLSYDKRPVDAKFASEFTKLSAIIAGTECNAESLILPEDVHYDIAQMRKLYHSQSLESKYQKAAVRSVNSREKEDENAAIAVDAVDAVSDSERYDYNNPKSGTLEYRPNVEYAADYDDYRRDDDNDDCNFEDNAAVSNSQGLTGDNLVAAPKLVNKIFTANYWKVKKIDMRQLKESMWSCLVGTDNVEKSTNSDAANTGEMIDETETMKESKRFSDIYKMLPKLLTKNNAELLSVPISFVSMLHVASEKELELSSVPDLSDVIINHGELSN